MVCDDFSSQPPRWVGCLIICLVVGCGLFLSGAALAQVERQTPHAAAGERTLYHPYLPNYATAEQTTVEIFNFGLGPTNYAAKFYNNVGQPVKTITGTLSVAQLLPIPLAGFALPDGDYSLVLDADGPLSTLVEVQTPQRATSTIG